MASSLASQMDRLALRPPSGAGGGGEAPMRRPGVGTVGRRINVMVNAFAVMPADITVKITPDDARRPVRFNRRIWHHLSTVMNPFGRVAVAFDGRAMAYSPTRLPAEHGQWTVHLPDEDGSTRMGNSFQVKITFIRPIQLGALRSFVRGGRTALDEGTVMSCIQALNVVIQHGPMSVHPSRGPSFYIRGTSPVQSRAFEIWAGYFSSLRPGTGAFLQAWKLASVLLALASLDRAGLTQDNLAHIPQQALIKLSRMVKGLRITPSVAGPDGRPVKRKIRSITSESARDYHFDCESGRTNVQDYFLAAYGVRLARPDGPCVLVSRTARYPIELCQVDIGQKYTAELTPQQVTDVIRATTIKPRERLAMVTRGIEAISPSNNKAFGQWQLDISRQPMQLQARVLEPPTIAYTQDRTLVPQGGAWSLQGKRFIAPARLQRWVVLVFVREDDFPQPVARSCIATLVQQLTQLGISVGSTPPTMHYANVPPSKAIPFIVRTVRSSGQQGAFVPPQLLVCFLTQKPSPYYGQIKFFGDVETGVATQCLNISKARRNDKMYYANVAHKINVKLGGSNSCASLGTPVSVPTVIFGADVSHPGPGSTAPSVAAVVASLDAWVCAYGTRMRTQESRQAIIVDLAEMVKSLLEQFRSQAKRPAACQSPSFYDAGMRLNCKIIFFRDGVSEGQYAQVLAHEVNAIRLACQRIDPGFRPNVTFIVCGKDSDSKTGNVPAGTTIDHTITSPFAFDWYTQSHGSLLGTSRSSHLTVLVDDSHFSADELQALAYHICYTYARTTRSVSLATPAYYAHLVCARATLYLATAGSSGLGVHCARGQNSRLYFM